MARNFFIAIFWIAIISVFLMVAPKLNEQQAFRSRDTDLVGVSLYDTAEERVGTVEEVVVDVEDGTVAYLIVRVNSASARSATDGGTSYIVVPWQNVLNQQANGGFTLTVNSTQVAQAPRLSVLPDTTQPGWDAGVRDVWQ